MQDSMHYILTLTRVFRSRRWTSHLRRNFHKGGNRPCHRHRSCPLWGYLSWLDLPTTQAADLCVPKLHSLCFSPIYSRLLQVRLGHQHTENGPGCLQELTSRRSLKKPGKREDLILHFTLFPPKHFESGNYSQTACIPPPPPPPPPPKKVGALPSNNRTSYID